MIRYFSESPHFLPVSRFAGVQAAIDLVLLRVQNALDRQNESRTSLARIPPGPVGLRARRRWVLIERVQQPLCWLLPRLDRLHAATMMGAEPQSSVPQYSVDREGPLREEIHSAAGVPVSKPVPIPGDLVGGIVYLVTELISPGLRLLLRWTAALISRAQFIVGFCLVPCRNAASPAEFLERVFYAGFRVELVNVESRESTPANTDDFETACFTNLAGRRLL